MNKACLTISLIVSIFFIGMKSMYSQDKEKAFEISAGMQILKITDKNFSPMIYKGFPFLTSVGFITETPDFFDALHIRFLKGNIHSATGNTLKSSKARLTGGTIDWVHLRKLNISTEKDNFYLGGVFNSSFTFYKRSYYGEDAYYLYQSSLGPAFHFTHPFVTGSRNIFFTTQLSAALVSYSVYPSYSSPMPDRLLGKDLNDISTIDYILGGKILAINKFQRVSYNLNLAYELNTKIAFKLNYHWELINVIRQNNLCKVSHDIYLSLIIK